MNDLSGPTEPNYDPDPDNPLYRRRDWYRTGVSVDPEMLRATHRRLHNNAEDGRIPYPSSIEIGEETAIHFEGIEGWEQRANCVVRQIHFKPMKVLYTVMLAAPETSIDRVDSVHVDVQDPGNTRYWSEFAIGDSVEVDVQGTVIEGLICEVTFGADGGVWYNVMMPDGAGGPWTYALHDVHEDLIVDFPSKPDDPNGGFDLLGDA